MDPLPPKSEQAGQPRGGARPLQPPRFVIHGERLTPTQRQERDRHRLLRMQLEGFDGPTWRHEVQSDVWEYAQRVLPALILSGEIFAIRARLGGPAFEDLRVPAGGITRDDAEDLASEVTLRSIGVFHRQLREDAWDLGMDITFRTWFVNLCALRFPAPYRLWLRERNQYRLIAIDPDAEELHPDLSPSSVIYVVEFERALDRIGDVTTKAMVCLDLAGYTDGEIAEATRTTVRAVEGRLAREREKSRRLRDLEARRDRARDFGSGVA